MEFHGPLSREKRLVWDLNQTLAAPPEESSKRDDVTGSYLDPFLSRHVQWHVSHPVNTLENREEFLGRYIRPLNESFPDREWRPLIMIAGEFEGQRWVAATGHILGTFVRPFCGIPATGHIATIRFGELYRVEDDIVCEVYTILDLIDLMRHAGIRPLPFSLGAEGLYPAPATQDGIVRGGADPAESEESVRLVERMIFEGLMKYDGKNLAGMNMDAFWTRDMMWYGPSGIGATRGVTGFQALHQAPFLAAFPDRRGGSHKTRFGEGMYVASGGWPSIHATHTGGSFLGLPPTHKRITMRVMDWWRREGSLLKENWVFIDIPDLLWQLDCDIFERIHDVQKFKDFM